MNMVPLFGQRAMSILYNFLRSVRNDKPFLLPSNVCPIVPLAFLKAEKPFEFVDISLGDFCIDRRLVLERLNGEPEKYGGILFVRSYGIESNVNPFFNQIKQIHQNILVIDDRCLCFPNFNPPSHPSIDLILFSTGYSKCIDIEFGGFGFINPKRAYEECETQFRQECLDDLTRQYKHAIQNRTPFFYLDSDWLNTSKPEMPFQEYRSWVESKIPSLKEQKRDLNSIYSENLPKEVQLDSKYQNWRFHIIVPKKTELLQKIFDEGLFASSHYASLDGIFSSTRSKSAEIVHESIVNLFNDQYFDEDRAMHMTKIINRHLDEWRRRENKSPEIPWKRQTE
ncbi:MAG: hypothetical protein ABIL68_00580 [bacterium]